MTTTRRYMLHGSLIGAAAGMGAICGAIALVSTQFGSTIPGTITVFLGLLSGTGFTLAGQWIGGTIGLKKEFPE